MKHDDAVRGLYGMVDVPWVEDASESEAASRAERLGRALLDGGARALQLRMKGAEAGAMLAALAALRPLCEARGARLIVNDRLDVALAGGADGVHLGQDDLPLAEARRIVEATVGRARCLIGVSTHDEAQAEAAAKSGADYLGFGPIFPTTSKARPDPVVGVERLAAVCRAVPVPVVAIGGITLARLDEVARAGASAAALIAAVNAAPDVAAAAREANRIFVAATRAATES